MKASHAIIVGYGKGVGLGIAQAFGKAGFHLSLISRSSSDSPGAISSTELAGLSTKRYQADAGEAWSLTEVIEQATLDFGPPDLLVYNAFVFAAGKPSGIDPEKLTSDFNVNVSGALTSSRAVLPLMLSKKSGTILFTGGGWAIYPSVDYASVSIGKAGLRSLAFMLAEEFQGTGVRFGTVTIMGTVSPGTPFDPARIGEAFLKAYQTPTETFTPEVQYTGS